MNLDPTRTQPEGRRGSQKNLLVEFTLVVLPKILNGVGLILINAFALQVLGPSMFGVFYLCTVAILLVDGVLGSAFDMGVVRLVPTLQCREPERARNIESAALFIKITIGVVVAILVFPFARPLAAAAFEMPGRSDLIYLTCAAAIAVLALRSVQAHLQVTGDFAAYGALDLFASLLRLFGVCAVLKYVMPDPAPALAMLALAPALAFAYGISTRCRGLIRFNAGVWSASGELMNFVKWTLMTFCVTTIAARIDLLLLKVWSTIEEVGLFSAGQVLTMIPELLGMYLAIVVSPKIMPAIENGTFPAMLKRFQILAVAVVGVGLVVGYVSLGLIGKYFFPAEYQRSVTILGILLPGALMSMANFPLVVPAIMFVRPRALVTIELIFLPVLIAAYFVAIRNSGAEGAAIVTTCGRTLKAFVQLAAAWWISSSPIDTNRLRVSGSGTLT